MENSDLFVLKKIELNNKVIELIDPCKSKTLLSRIKYAFFCIFINEYREERDAFRKLKNEVLLENKKLDDDFKETIKNKFYQQFAIKCRESIAEKNNIFKDLLMKNLQVRNGEYLRQFSGDSSRSVCDLIEIKDGSQVYFIKDRKNVIEFYSTLPEELKNGNVSTSLQSLLNQTIINTSAGNEKVLLTMEYHEVEVDKKTCKEFFGDTENLTFEVSSYLNGTPNDCELENTSIEIEVIRNEEGKISSLKCTCKNKLTPTLFLDVKNKEGKVIASGIPIPKQSIESSVSVKLGLEDENSNSPFKLKHFKYDVITQFPRVKTYWEYSLKFEPKLFTSKKYEWIITNKIS